jgi:PAS domain S-box-containing protein
MLVYEQATLQIVAANYVLAESYGYTKQELLSMRITDLVPAEDVELLTTFFLTAAHTGPWIGVSDGFADRTRRHQHKDGTVIDVEVAGDSLTVAGVSCRVWAVTDVTERNRAEAERMAMAEQLAVELMGQNERLRAVDELKDQFVSVVSHELRTPLTAIRGYLEIVLGGEPGPLTPEQQRCLEIVDASCKQLLRVVSDLLLIGKSEAGQLALEIAEVDLRALLAECVVAAKPSADAKLIELRLADESAIEPIAGDYGRLSQAVANIISNAIKFTEVGHVDVRLLAEPERAVVEIADTGVGVPATEVDHLFVPFFRASTATREAIPGAGLGLSIAKEIIDAHGGRISLETQEGSGTSIRVELPMAVAG